MLSERVYEYACYAWLLRKKPVWSMVIYTDEAIWTKPVPSRFWYAYESQQGKQYHSFDVIKVKAEKSRDLIKTHSLLCKMLALKADDRDADPEALVYEMYRAAAEMKKTLTTEQLLLLDQWIKAYKKVSDSTVHNIKKEITMEGLIETTITEHVFNQGVFKGREEGKAEGEAKGEAKGEIAGQMKMLEMFHLLGKVSDEEFDTMMRPLRQKLKGLLQKDENAPHPAS